MSDKFKAIVLNKSGDQFSREIKTLDKNFFKENIEQKLIQIFDSEIKLKF